MGNSLRKWEPFGGAWEFQSDLDRIFDSWTRTRGTRGETELTSWAPAVDISENEESLNICVELPGLKKEEIKVTVDSGMLTISGERKMEKENSKNNYHRIERSYGAFARSFSLPATVDAAQVKAEMNNGVLNLLLPKREEAKPKQIEVAIR